MKAARFAAFLLVTVTATLRAQHTHGGTARADQADEAMNGMDDENARPHLHLSPERVATSADSARAGAVVARLRSAIARYDDTSAAIAAGYVFRPRFKRPPRVYHFTNRRNAVKSALTFDPEHPTSLLYERQTDGSLKLIGAMYTAPKRSSLDDLNARLPLSIARWHQHVNLCMPKRGDEARLTERSGGRPVFGPRSGITTKEACDAVGGRFSGETVPWMVHVNVFAGDDLGTIFRHEH